jgi:hypothetical protein
MSALLAAQRLLQERPLNGRTVATSNAIPWRGNRLSSGHNYLLIIKLHNIPPAVQAMKSPELRPALDRIFGREHLLRI